MIVWGGASPLAGDGARYSPTADSWTLLPAAGAPSARVNHTAVWTGSDMIVWGGNFFGDGARYSLGANAWTALPATDAPSARYLHSAVWTGTEMIVWGGIVPSGCPCFNDGARFRPLPVANTVAIDIKPGSSPNSINLGSAGVIPVAILSSPSFDAQQVNPATITLAGARVKLIGKGDRYSCSANDVNGDGLMDLVCHVVTTQFLIEIGDSIAVLEGETFGGIAIRGQDSIRIVP